MVGTEMISLRALGAGLGFGGAGLGAGGSGLGAGGAGLGAGGAGLGAGGAGGAETGSVPVPLGSPTGSEGFRQSPLGSSPVLPPDGWSGEGTLTPPGFFLPFLLFSRC